MANYSIIVTNNAPGCDNEIAQQISVSAGCSSYLVRLTPTSTAIGPFNVYIVIISLIKIVKIKIEIKKKKTVA